MKRVVLAGLTALAAVITMTVANAADLPRQRAMPAKAPAYVATVYNWTGTYVGLNGGYGWGRSNWTSGAGTTGSFDVRGGLIGGTLGYNWQMNQLVFGLEGDVDWSNIKGDSNAGICAAGVCETRNTWLGTARGRIGYAFSSVMPYITGGAAFGGVKMSPVGGRSETDTRFGWALGGGVEAAIAGPWTAKLEYLYADLGNANCSTAACAVSTDVAFHTNIVRAGINYRF